VNKLEDAKLISHCGIVLQMSL